jgi:cell wall-associated NlpC family hydrolase
MLASVMLVLFLGITAIAQPAAPPAAPPGSAAAALAVGNAQLGKPFQYGAEGPDAFSCVGLMRYVLKTAGVDAYAPWVPEAYLSTYAPVAPGDLQPGDIVIYPDWATMYAGDGMVLNSNIVDGQVSLTPMSAVGEPLGIVRPPYTS